LGEYRNDPVLSSVGLTIFICKHNSSQTDEKIPTKLYTIAVYNYEHVHEGN